MIAGRNVGSISESLDLERRVRGYAADAVAECFVDRITGVRRFQSGERHAVYRVSYVDLVGCASDLVVRIATSEEARDCRTAEREAAVLTKVQGIAGPHLYDFRCESPWFDAPATCMQFVSGEQSDMTAVAPQDIERLGAVIAQVHALPIDDLREWFPTDRTRGAYADERVDVIRQKLTSVRNPLPAALQRRLRAAWVHVTDAHRRARTDKSLDAGDRLVLQHGDIASGNVVWGATPVLIDWEYARLGDQADEIAYVLGQNDLSAAQREAFWRGYRDSSCGDGLDAIADRVAWWEPVNLLGSALWWVERWSERSAADTGDVDHSAPKLQDYYLNHAIRRLERFERLADPALGTEQGDVRA